ncbi:DUF4190 domain-containing protein [Knoellia aerolata]|uniref:DUF4190 domain-containing protein n=1 Tax=Knoellia aerolata DSM 18566 TaxID=1385519 RepID=A0A0A0JPV9_9MICO|nr:DUF4190 domain-containing protein [Knoellia aerolata]KGN37631.1 hypothetical protein N801_00970 [Knoellia aerolata DSM 18566]
MSENDKDQSPGEYTDPTAGPDWTAPSGSQGSGTPADSSPSDPTHDRPAAPDSAPTEQIPQGSDAPRGPEVPPVPPAPSYESPYQAPRSPGDPYAGSSAQPSNPYAATPPPPPYDPYAAPQPPYDPYAATGGQWQQQTPQAQPGGYPAYQAPGQWQAPPAAYGAPAPQNTSALVLTILSGIVTLSCCIPGIAPLILGIMALNKQSTDPEGSRRLTKWGWIAFGVGMALVVLGIIGFIALGAAGVWDDGGYSSDSDFSY